ncbi:MAG: alanine racemase [Actinobacteria bacterium]|nr:alanine racemase [Actinomycetota bacterium]
MPADPVTVKSIKDKRYAWAEINLSNLAANIRLIKDYCSRSATEIMAVVKAGGYGHGAVEAAKEALKSGAGSLGVVLVEEGTELRKAGIKAPVYILGETPPEAYGEIIENDLIISINSYDSAKRFAGVCKKYGSGSAVNINIDTGMNRLGINYRNAVEQVLGINRLEPLLIRGVSTHFSCAAIKDDQYSSIQWTRFQEIINGLYSAGLKIDNFHCANSAAFFRYRHMHMDMARIGISMYGLIPYDEGWESWINTDVRHVLSGLKPVFSLKARISFIKEVDTGQPISYCGTFKTTRKSIIATIPMGYADGYSRILSNKARIIINGIEAPVVGNVTMDQFMVDVTDACLQFPIKAGDEVVLMGNPGSGEGKGNIPAEEIAGILGTINYEVVCMFGKRVPHVYVR